MFDLYSLLHNMYKTTDAIRTMRCKHQKIKDNWDRDFSIDKDSIFQNAEEIEELEHQHTYASTQAYEQLPRNTYREVRDTVLKYAHRDNACGCCFTDRRKGVKQRFTPSDMSEHRISIMFKGSKIRVLEQI
jgi:hypothetical protein